MEVQIKLTKVRHDQLKERLGTDEAIREWLQSYLNRRLLEKADELGRAKEEQINLQ